MYGVKKEEEEEGLTFVKGGSPHCDKNHKTLISKFAICILLNNEKTSIFYSFSKLIILE